MKYCIDLTGAYGRIGNRVKILFNYTSMDGDEIQVKQSHGHEAWEALELFSDDVFDTTLMPRPDLTKPCTITLSKVGPP